MLMRENGEQRRKGSHSRKPPGSLEIRKGKRSTAYSNVALGIGRRNFGRERTIVPPPPLCFP